MLCFIADKYPQIEDLAMVIPLALVLCGIRVLFERLVAQPIGTCIGICPRGARKPYPNAILERVFLTITQRPDEKRLKVKLRFIFVSEEFLRSFMCPDGMFNSRSHLLSRLL